ncbi:hypothetical protein BD311DRAFT_770724 [Dichomitus squalens]|uniref:Uncharacterized protein n=1 Tax=Dichomitus squalens TaxID=114155 RepID=A0A4Q9M5L3_9APHY|nr:hypothetical protein BD311DRAFT_770724 [Dichomitus squalens]
MAFFPNLEVLEQPVNSYHLELHSRHALRRLSITELSTSAPDGHSRQVHLLHLRNYPHDLQSYRQSIRDISPVGLSLHSYIDLPQYWDLLPLCHTWERTPQPGWMGRSVESMQKLSLVCLRLVTPQYPAYQDAGWADEDVQAMVRLPNKLPLAMPTLRYIAWANSRATCEREWYEDEIRLVVDSGKLVAMSKWEGERVIGLFLLAADLDRISRIFGTEHLE